MTGRTGPDWTDWIPTNLDQTWEPTTTPEREVHRAEAVGALEAQATVDQLSRVVCFRAEKKTGVVLGAFKQLH